MILFSLKLFTLFATEVAFKPSTETSPLRERKRKRKRKTRRKKKEDMNGEERSWFSDRLTSGKEIELFFESWTPC